MITNFRKRNRPAATFREIGDAHQEGSEKFDRVFIAIASARATGA